MYRRNQAHAWRDGARDGKGSKGGDAHGGGTATSVSVGRGTEAPGGAEGQAEGGAPLVPGHLLGHQRVPGGRVGACRGGLPLVPVGDGRMGHRAGLPYPRLLHRQERPGGKGQGAPERDGEAEERAGVFSMTMTLTMQCSSARIPRLTRFHWDATVALDMQRNISTPFHAYAGIRPPPEPRGMILALNPAALHPAVVASRSMNTLAFDRRSPLCNPSPWFNFIESAR